MKVSRHFMIGSVTVKNVATMLWREETMSDQSGKNKACCSSTDCVARMSEQIAKGVYRDIVFWGAVLRESMWRLWRQGPRQRIIVYFR